MKIDVALVPRAAQVAPGRVLIVIDQIRASTTITTVLDLGCTDLLLAGDVRTARRLGRQTGFLLAGERLARKPPGFDFDNSPSELARAGLGGRGLILSTTNGTAVLRRLRAADAVLVGCLRNARAVASAAVSLAGSIGPHGSVQVVCAGRLGRFVLEDAVAAGVIVGRFAVFRGRVAERAQAWDPRPRPVPPSGGFSPPLDGRAWAARGGALRRPRGTGRPSLEGAGSTLGAPAWPGGGGAPPPHPAGPPWA